MKKDHLSGILVLLVFTLFSVSILMVLLTGADVARGLTRQDRESYDQRTAVQYVTTRIRQAEQRGMISVCQYGDGDALVFSQDIEGCRYQTMVYAWDGYMRELFCESGYEQAPEFGEKILPIAGLEARLEAGVLQVHLVFEDGRQEDLTLQLRSERGSGT